MLQRKNLVVDSGKIKALAVRLRTSQSDAVRRAVDTMLLESTVMEAVDRIRARGTLRDARKRSRRGR